MAVHRQLWCPWDLAAMWSWTPETFVQTGSLEGADDPAGIFRKKGNVVGQIAAILSVLSLQKVASPRTTTTMVSGHPAW